MNSLMLSIAFLAVAAGVVRAEPVTALVDVAPVQIAIDAQ